MLLSHTVTTETHTLMDVDTHGYTDTHRHPSIHRYIQGYTHMLYTCPNLQAFALSLIAALVSNILF